MNYFSNSHENDIFLWADGYWCYRGNFHEQPRQTYAYRLVMVNTPQWNSLTGAELYQRPNSSHNRNSDRRAHERRHS